MREALLELLFNSGSLASPDALEFILRQKDPLGYVSALVKSVKEMPPFLSLEYLSGAFLAGRCEAPGEGTPAKPSGVMNAESSVSAPVPDPSKFVGGAALDAPLGAFATTVQSQTAVLARTPEPLRSVAADTPSRVHQVASASGPSLLSGLNILRDVSPNSKCKGNVKEFVDCFNGRFKGLKRLLRQNRELAAALPVDRARSMGDRVRLIAMVNEVRTTTKGHRIVELEDESSDFAALVLKDNAHSDDPIVPDEVVGLVGRWGSRGDLFIVERIIRPDVPAIRDPKRSNKDVCAAFISDIHFGSKTFLDDVWAAFMVWLAHSKDGGEFARAKIRYLVVSGDIVDGIGVYPDQEKELRITDIYEQYQGVAEHMEPIPEDIKIIMLPGNHDAVRPSEPQPTFPPEIQALFRPSTTFVGNPCWFQLEGLDVLAYHGRSFDDLINWIPNLSYGRPMDGMKEMLRRRHLAPIYGGKTPLATEGEDGLLIDRVPDIFVTGHTHSCAADTYRGIILVNSSTWQSQTSFQKMHNFDPDPGKVPIVNLMTGRVHVKSFTDASPLPTAS